MAEIKNTGSNSQMKKNVIQPVPTA